MKTLSYSPEVEVYVAIRGKSGYSYKDLTEDVVQVSVALQTNGASTFSVRLQNVNHKYNGLFEPFDKISVSCTKIDSHKLITGYITDAPKFTTYGSDITVKGSCPIYRLQQYYWDPHLVESAKLLGMLGAEDNWDAVIMNLLTKVGGYSASQVIIGSVPDEAISFAKEMYQANVDSAQQLYDRTNEFFKVLQTHGPAISTGVAGATGATVGAIDGATGSGISLLGQGVNFSMKEAEFVKLWGNRINKYYEKYNGSAGGGVPLVGHGEQWARSGYAHKMDPRLSPAMAIKESGGGRNCFESYNAWGWGIHSGGLGASSWDEAIEKHVTGLAKGYGDMTSIHDVIYKYAPPDDGNDTDGYISFLEEIFAEMASY